MCAHRAADQKPQPHGLQSVTVRAHEAAVSKERVVIPPHTNMLRKREAGPPHLRHRPAILDHREAPCVRPLVGELAALSLVDLWLKERAVIYQQPPGDGEAGVVDATPSSATPCTNLAQKFVGNNRNASLKAGKSLAMRSLSLNPT